MKRFIATAFLAACVVPAPSFAASPSSSPATSSQPSPVGVVSNIRILANGQEDLSSLESWKKANIKDGMTDQQKAIACFETVVRYQHEMDPPLELLHDARAVTDALKTFHVYGYNQCGPAACHFVELARFAGFKARGVGINGHTVAEVFYDDAWHMFDASYINYFPKPDGKVASVAEIIDDIKQWRKDHIECKPGPDAEKAIREIHKADGWTGWKTQGPPLLAASPFLDAKGYLPARLMDWAHVMRLYDGTKNAEYETGYSMGYQVNVQLRPGEALVRNWSHKGLHVNMAIEPNPHWLALKPGEGEMAYTPKYGDLAPGRVGNGTLEYNVPLADAGLQFSALRYENLASLAAGEDGPALRAKDPDKPGILEIRMTTPYVFLSGQMSLKATVGEGGSVVAGISDNNGMDWAESESGESGTRKVNMLPFVMRRYEYRLRFVIKGKGTGLDLLKLTHDIQHSQRPLPALTKGENTIHFQSGPQEGTVTVEASTDSRVKDAQLTYKSFYPKMEGIVEKAGLGVDDAGKTGEITFPIATPAGMTRLRIFTFYRARDKADGWDVQASFDSGKTWRDVGRCEGSAVFASRYFTVDDIPAGTKWALVRWSGQQRNATRITNFRIDADYPQPNGGVRPVKVTYVWEEDGHEKKDEHVARSADETYKIICGEKPTMKSLTVELAK